MKLPQGDQAIIDARKLTDYVLSSEHDDGKHKAVLFRELLGITADRVDLLIDGLRQAAIDSDVQPGRLDRYGQRYIVDFDLIGPGGWALVVTNHTGARGLDRAQRANLAPAGHVLYTIEIGGAE